jgi:membrane associated rhomboid family serine protease
MIPLQDVVPTGRVPLVTLSLIALNAVRTLAPAGGDVAAGTLVLLPFTHASSTVAIVNVWALWLFGDNVEARMGRTTAVALYVGGGVAGGACAWWLTPSAVAFGGTCAVGAVLGAYAALLPRSRVLVLIPAPPLVSEAPALFLIGLWWLTQFTAVMVPPPAAWPLLAAALAFTCGAAVALGLRTPQRW